MKTIGLLGGMSWESSIEYERLINTEVRRRLGGVHSADLLIRSYDFAAIEELQASGSWDEAGKVLAADARALQEAGADLIVLCTNTMHVVADAIEEAITVPFLHLADATAEAVKRAAVGSVLLLGTSYTMEMGFYKERLRKHGLEVAVPDPGDRVKVNEIIFEELVQGIVKPESKATYLDIIESWEDQVGGVIAGCTEIELLVGPDDVDIPYFPTTYLHAMAAVDLALG
jgi:aspartate racemase